MREIFTRKMIRRMEKTTVIILAVFFYFQAQTLIYSLQVDAALYSTTVRAGSWAEYNVKSYVFTNVTEEQLIKVFGKDFNRTLQYYKDINGTVWKLFVNETANNGEITFTVLQALKNGSLIPMVYKGNVFTGLGNLSLWFISPNVKAGQSLYISNQTSGPIANKTDFEKFARANRECVFSYFLRQEREDVMGLYQCAWDRETGVLCLMLSGVKYPASHVDFRTNIYCEISRTNLWTQTQNNTTGPPYQIYAAIVFFSLALLTTYIVYIKKIKKTNRKRFHRK